MAGEDLNYYYFGHLMAAGLVRLSGVAPDVGYNLAVAAFFALSVVAAFGLAYALGDRLATGLWGVALCIVAGTIGSGLELVQEGGPLRTYDWFGASRVIEGTINEFPAFSFTLADLHGHVMAIPFSLLALAFGLQLALAGPAAAAARAGRARARRGRDRDRHAVRDQRLVVPRRRAGSCCSAALVRAGEPASLRERGRTLVWALAALLLAVIAVLPFLLTYDAAADGLGRRHGARVVLELGARPRRALRPVRLPRRDAPTRSGSRARATRGARRAGGGGSRCSRARCWPPPTSPRSRALVVLGWVAAHAAFLSRAPVVERFVVGADRRRAAVPPDPGAGLRPATRSTAASSTA